MSFFAKMTQGQFLRGISVKSKEDLLLMRICKRFDEISETPVVFHWRCRMEEIVPPEEVKRGIAI